MYGCISLLAMLFQYQQMHGRCGETKCMELLVFGVWLSFVLFFSFFFLVLLFLIRSTLLFDCSFKGYSLPSGAHDGPKGTCVPRKAK